MDIGVELREILTKLEKRKGFVTEQLSAAPSGSLSYECSGNELVLVQETRLNGKRKRHQLDQEPDLAAALLRKMVLQDECRSVEHNIKLINALIDRADVYSETAEVLKLLDRYPGIDSKLTDSVFNDGEISDWSSAQFEQSNYKPEEKKQINSHGLKLRSKSELLISEKFYEFNVDFRYEQVLHIKGMDIIPDFTIRRKDGKIFIWEHEGLTSVKSYLDWQVKKHKLYAEAGFVPWDNLIVTYDNVEGMIDLRIIESEIQNKLIV